MDLVFVHFSLTCIKCECTREKAQETGVGEGVLSVFFPKDSAHLNAFRMTVAIKYLQCSKILQWILRKIYIFDYILSKWMSSQDSP